MTRRDFLLAVAVACLAAILAFNIGIGIIVINDHKVTSDNATALRHQVMNLQRLQATLNTQGHAAVQQNVNARFDDCIAGDQVRDALYAQTLEAQSTTNKVLYRLVPALNTPEVKAIVARDQARELKAYKPRGTKGCGTYAIKSVPFKARGQYHIPKP